jgi:hypothetical protein
LVVENAVLIEAISDKVYYTEMNTYPNCDFRVVCSENHYLDDSDGLRCLSSLEACDVLNALEITPNCDPIRCKFGFHVSGKICESDKLPCDIENGNGVKEWIPDEITGGRWTQCQALSCDPGYTYEKADTSEPKKQCGACKNMFDTKGVKAASTYSGACNIASCMYQGELYRLENNECIQICDTVARTDATGIMQWNSNTKKCDRTCKPGYIGW